MKLSVDLYTRKNRTMLGQPIGHSWAELYFIEQVLLENHFDVIIEIGTWQGGLSVFFGLHALRMAARAITFDIIQEPKGGIYGILKPILPLKFHRKDILGKHAKQVITKHIAYGRTLLYIDGAKLKAFKLYAPKLKVGDILMCHDRINKIAKEKKYSQEIGDKDIKKTVEKHGFKPLHDKEVNQLGGIYCFIKTARKPKAIKKHK